MVVARCVPTNGLPATVDTDTFAHPVIAKVVSSPAIFQKVLSGDFAEIACNEADLQFDANMARGLEYDFASFLTETEQRRNWPLANDSIVIRITATVVLPDGEPKQIKLPPLRTSFAAEQESEEDQDDTLDDHDTIPEPSSAPFPLSCKKPSGRLPHYHRIFTSDGTSYGM